jgi:hypothetical protein
MVIDHLEEFSCRCFAKPGFKILLLKLLKQDLHLIQAAFAKVNRRSLVTIEIDQRGRIIAELALQIISIF